MKKIAYVGCRTTKERNARGKGIKVYRIDDNGEWTLLQTVKTMDNPSYLCMDKKREFLYTVHGDFSGISSFHVEKSGELTYLNSVSTGGNNPVHLSVDKTNRWIFVANLQTGSIAVIERKEDGQLGELKELYRIEGKNASSISHPHQVAQDKKGNYLLVSCQGRANGFGQVDVFRIHADSGRLEKTCVVRSREIAEPRHLVFHPNNRWCYGVNEKDYSVTYYHFEEKTGNLCAKQIVPTLPDTYTGDGWASGIIINEDGSFLVVSNRKHDSITSFRIDRESGKLLFCDCIKTGGGQPRFITWDETGKNVLAANETTDSLTVFSLDEIDGHFTDLHKKIETESPVCVLFS